jgi:hypothetical protein
MNGALDQSADNVLIAELASGMIDHLADEQRPVLHETKHDVFSL